MAKIIQLKGAQEEVLLLNATHIAEVYDLDHTAMASDREAILRKDPEAKTYITLAGTMGGGMIVRNTVEEVVKLVNG